MNLKNTGGTVFDHELTLRERSYGVGIQIIVARSSAFEKEDKKEEKCNKNSVQLTRKVLCLT